MARQNHGPLSRAKGKIGGVVYQQYEGMQISREYQPVVKNPQTQNQVLNRAKFKLSSQIVAQFKSVISTRFTNLSAYERMRRAAAVSAIHAVIDDGDFEAPNALVDSVITALNAKSISTLPAPTLSVSSNTLSITATSDNTVIYTICEYDKTKGDLLAVRTGDFEASATPRTMELSDTNRSVVMVVALAANTDEGRATISNAMTTATSFENEIARAVVAGDIDVTNISGLVNTPA